MTAVTQMRPIAADARPFDTIEAIIADIQAGKMVVLLDDEDRENEGDLVMAASAVTAEHINFMINEGRGLVCMPVSKARADRLGLNPMVEQNGSPYSTNFTVSIEAADGVTTGISCADRARTIQVAAADAAIASDLVQPGHIFPLIAQPGGVLARAGHTEATVDLVTLAGVGDSGVIVEILNNDGTMARRDDLLAFAKQHGLKIGLIADLIHYRLANEKTVQRKQVTQLETAYGTFNCVVYQDNLAKQTHVALVKGEVSASEPVLVRVHTPNVLTDVLGTETKTDKWTLAAAATAIKQSPHAGVLLLLGKPVITDDIILRTENRLQYDQRTIGLGSQILKDLGVRRMQLMSNQDRFYGLSGFDLVVEEIIHSR